MASRSVELLELVVRAVPSGEGGGVISRERRPSTRCGLLEHEVDDNEGSLGRDDRREVEGRQATARLGTLHLILVTFRCV